MSKQILGELKLANELSSKKLDQSPKERNEEQRKRALDVHLAEYKATRDLLNIQIQQDRISLSLGLTLIAALVAAIATILSKAERGSLMPPFWLIPACAPSVLSCLAIMNARSIQAGLEVNSYVVLHLKPAISALIGSKEITDPLLRSEEYYPRVDLLHKLTPTQSVSDCGKSIRRFSALARVLLFIAPSLGCLIGTSGFLLQGSRITVKWNPILSSVAAGVVISTILFVLSLYTYYVLFQQMKVFESITEYFLTHPNAGISLGRKTEDCGEREK